MSILFKLGAILVMAWFYTSGKKIGAPAIKWAIIGLVGYGLVYFLTRETILSLFIGSASKNTSLIFVVTQIPVACAGIVVFFVRKKLIKDEEKKGNSSE